MNKTYAIPNAQFSPRLIHDVGGFLNSETIAARTPVSGDITGGIFRIASTAPGHSTSSRQGGR
jgi:hypothetical protein